MICRGHIKNGNIRLDEPVALPEGAVVNVEVLPSGDQAPPPFPDRRALLRLPVGATGNLEAAVGSDRQLVRFGPWVSITPQVPSHRLCNIRLKLEWAKGLLATYAFVGRYLAVGAVP